MKMKTFFLLLFLVSAMASSSEESKEESIIEINIITLLLFVYVCVGHLIEKFEVAWLHESAVSILIGVILGIILTLAGFNIPKFNHESFFFYILPPIIFCAGYTLKKRNFLRNFGWIVLFGVIGTIVIFVCIAIAAIFSSKSATIMEVYFNENSGKSVELSTRECLLLAAVLSATDSVAVVSLISEKTYPKVYGIVFGEGVINDALAIVIFQTVDWFFNYSGSTNFGVKEAFKVVSKFVVMVTSSVGIGLFLGLFSAFATQKFKSFDEFYIKQVSLIILFGYMAYSLCEVLHFSGIMAMFTCGVVMTHYTYHNISDEAKSGSRSFVETTSYLAEAFVFVYLGFHAWTYLTNDGIALIFSLVMLVSILAARAICVFVLTGLTFWFESKSRPDLKEQCAVWYSGVMRGAVAFALALEIKGDSESSQNIMLSTTLVIVLFTVGVFGTLSGVFIDYFLGKEEDEHEPRTNSAETRGSFCSLSPVMPKDDAQLGKIASWWKNFDDKVMKPMFGGRIFKKAYDYRERSSSLASDNNRLAVDMGLKYPLLNRDTGSGGYEITDRRNLYPQDSISSIGSRPFRSSTHNDVTADEFALLQRFESMMSGYDLDMDSHAIGGRLDGRARRRRRQSQSRDEHTDANGIVGRGSNRSFTFTALPSQTFHGSTYDPMQTHLPAVNEQDSHPFTQNPSNLNQMNSFVHDDSTQK